MLLALVLTSASASGCVPVPQASPFQPPVRVSAGVAPLRVPTPGFASPCWGDVDGDGKPDLLVGDFASEIRAYRHVGGGGFANGVPLQAGGRLLQVPDIA